MGECQPLEESLSHVPDVGERRIVRSAPGIDKGRSLEGPGLAGGIEWSEHAPW